MRENVMSKMPNGREDMRIASAKHTQTRRHRAWQAHQTAASFSWLLGEPLKSFSGRQLLVPADDVPCRSVGFKVCRRDEYFVE
jgi:hypothetical protein